ncbi:MAG: hypothetical protein DHS20C01_28440 [marine bacterium B5-7]|nr:MAG: hypothetical protein DHS20C01_28440 [marine bacterium B5-7]
MQQSQPFMRWFVTPRLNEADLPGEIITVRPGFDHPDMPAEVAILLPSNRGPEILIDHVIETTPLAADTMIGLFLANPLLNIQSAGKRLKHAKIKWVTNLPSVSQQDREFSGQLADVDLDHNRELSCLAQFKSFGFRIIAVVTDAEEAKAAVEINPDVIFVMPRVADFAAGFPSLRQRSSAAQAVAGSMHSHGWSGSLLGLGLENEIEHPSLWPGTINALVHLPSVVK